MRQRTSDPHPPPHLGYVNLEALLIEIALIRFDERSRFDTGRVAVVVREVRELYLPLSVPEGFYLGMIVFDDYAIRTNGSIRLVYNVSGSPATGMNNAHFTWHRGMRGREARSSRTHIRYDSGVHYWTQHTYDFEARIPITFPQDEVDDFINSQKITTWEMQGYAMSVSVQGMERIVVFDQEGHEIVSSVSDARFGSHSAVHLAFHRLEHHSLYQRNDETLTRIGYSWLVDADSSRRQFVLEPGTYTFHVEGVIGEPDLLIRHFADREVVSSVDFGEKLAGQDFASFTITVTPDTSGSGDTLTLNP